MRQKRLIIILLSLLFLFSFTEEYPTLAEEKKEKQGKSEQPSDKENVVPFKLPENMLSLEKSNTFPNTPEDIEVIEPSEAVQTLLEDVTLPIENPSLIKLLNDSVIKPSPLAIGYRAEIYLGRWPLHYQSDSTSINWDYQHVNVNEINNQGGRDVQELRYVQEEEITVKGALTNKIENPESIKKMILLKSKEKTKLPLSFSTVVGKNTKLDNYYHVAEKKRGELKAYVPAVNEKGHIIFGEVYIQLKGSNKELIIKNVTKQGIGAWIPVQDYISLSFQLK